MDTQGLTDVVDLPNIEPMRCSRVDMTSDSVVGVWGLSYHGLYGPVSDHAQVRGGPEGVRWVLFAKSEKVLNVA